jgi:hypothetical protein
MAHTTTKSPKLKHLMAMKCMPLPHLASMAQKRIIKYIHIHQVTPLTVLMLGLWALLGFDSCE